MFEIGGEYANRRGKYTVLAFNDPKMTVRYEDGTEANLNINIQERIWENILAEQEATASRNRSAQKSQIGTKHFIKAVSIPTEDMAFPGWQERVVLAPTNEDAKNIQRGDRFIYYAVEARVFFAVVTITGEVYTANPKNYFFNTDQRKASFFPVDTDAAVITLENGIPYDSMELESQPKFKSLKIPAETFLPINEDDFELLAELLTEASETDSESDAVDNGDEDFIEDE